ncbi:hypothetical protein CR513_52160, partial [Mucuna pruriens]
MEDSVTNDERLVPPMNLNSKDVEEKEEGCVSSEKEEDLGNEESGSGGVINNLISTLSPTIGKATEHESEGGDQGGLFSKMVSNFFHQSEGEEGVVETQEDKDKHKEEEIMNGEKIKRFKTENGSVVHNIVSHLPASIPDDAVPTADEATFLINSLVLWSVTPNGLAQWCLKIAVSCASRQIIQIVK